MHGPTQQGGCTCQLVTCLSVRQLKMERCRGLYACLYEKLLIIMTYQGGNDKEENRKDGQKARHVP